MARQVMVGNPLLNVWAASRMLAYREEKTLRLRMTAKYAWAIPCEEALNLVASYGPLVEVGAGTGYWAMLLQRMGADVIAYDLYPPTAEDVNPWHERPKLWHPVLRGGPEVAGEHPDRTLFLCWPPHSPTPLAQPTMPEDPTGWERREREGMVLWVRPDEYSHLASGALDAYEQAGGQTLIYVGEGVGGCTGGNWFHARIGQGCEHDEGCDCPEPGWEEIASLTIPRWNELRDALWVYRRKA